MMGILYPKTRNSKLYWQIQSQMKRVINNRVITIKSGHMINIKVLKVVTIVIIAIITKVKDIALVRHLIAVKESKKNIQIQVKIDIAKSMHHNIANEGLTHRILNHLNSKKTKRYIIVETNDLLAMKKEKIQKRQGRTYGNIDHVVQALLTKSLFLQNEDQSFS